MANGWRHSKKAANAKVLIEQSKIQSLPDRARSPAVIADLTGEVELRIFLGTVDTEELSLEDENELKACFRSWRARIRDARRWKSQEDFDSALKVACTRVWWKEDSDTVKLA